MQVLVEDSDRPITKVNIVHRGKNIKFTLIFPDEIRSSGGLFREPNYCTIFIDDVLELKNIMRLFGRAEKEIELHMGCLMEEEMFKPC